MWYDKREEIISDFNETCKMSGRVIYYGSLGLEKIYEEILESNNLNGEAQLQKFLMF